MKKRVSMYLIALLLLVSGVAAFGFYLWNQFTTSNGAPEKIEIVYEVRTGTPFQVIAQELQLQRIIKNSQFFRLYGRITGKAEKVKAGEYLFNSKMTPQEVFEVLISGKSIDRVFTVAEGLNIFEIAKLYEFQGFGLGQEFLRLVKDKELIQELLSPHFKIDTLTSLEGYLFPETYRLTKYTSAKTLITNMVNNFLKAYKSVVGDSAVHGLTPHQLVTLASIVEKETGASSERPVIASVFYNRLDKNMKLQTDPTVLYAKTLETGVLESNITRVDLSMDHNYNTYNVYGLPPGPISNPGKASLEAVVHPAQTDYLYFVSQNNGTHIFSKEYKDHARAVQEFQMDKAKREGHSWRELRRVKDVDQ